MEEYRTTPSPSGWAPERQGTSLRDSDRIDAATATMPFGAVLTGNARWYARVRDLQERTGYDVQTLMDGMTKAGRDGVSARERIVDFAARTSAPQDVIAALGAESAEQMAQRLSSKKDPAMLREFAGMVALLAAEELAAASTTPDANAVYEKREDLS